jgi:hypothetical protein
MVRALGDRKDGLASVFGTGVMMDTTAASWDDEALTTRGIAGRPASEWVASQARDGRT